MFMFSGIMVVSLLGNRNTMEKVKSNASGGKLVEEKIEKRENEQQKIQKEMKDTGLDAKTLEDISILNKKLGDASESSTNPEYYAGIYVNDEKNIVVNVTEASSNDLERIDDICSSDNYKVKNVEYSLEELKQIKEKIVKFMEKEESSFASEELKQLHADIVGVGIVVKKNSVEVSIKDLDEEKKQLFKNVTDADCVLYVNAENEIQANSDLQPGQSVFVYTNSEINMGSYYSLGCRVVWIDNVTNDKYGFITAAHNTSVGQNVYLTNNVSSSNRIGYICRSMWAGNIDAAFIHVDNSKYNLSNVIYGVGPALTPSWYYTSVAEGMTISKYGQTTGTIESASYTCTYGEVTISDMIKSTAISRRGDSGGIVWAYDSTNGVVAVVGIVAASDDTYGYSTKYSSVRVTLGLHTY